MPVSGEFDMIEERVVYNRQSNFEDEDEDRKESLADEIIGQQNL